KDPKTGEPEGLSFEFNLCEAVANWEQVSLLLQIKCSNRCQNKTLCMEKLKLVLPETPPYLPKEFGSCAVIGNSGDLLKTRFGKEIDGYDVVIRENGAPEVPIRNAVYLMLGASFGSAAKGTGLKALEFALSMCESVDMYGFTVDPGYKEWTRYFSESRKGHTPLHGRAYYQMMECLGLIKIHSPMRADPNRVVKWVPSQSTILAARTVSEKILRRVGAGSEDPLRACEIKKQVRRPPTAVSSLRKAAIDHQKSIKGTTLYPLEHNPGHGMLCTFPMG
ncbi:unnamed protein product, partial [Linum tenue]